MPGLAHTLHLAGDLRVEEDQGVQVAVARVEDVSHFQAVAIADFADAPQHVGKPGAGHHSILHVEFRADAPDRAEGVLAARPEKLAFGLIGGYAHDTRVVFVANGYDGGGLFLDALAQSLGLYEQHGGRVQRVARARIGLDRLQDHLIHHFDGAAYYDLRSDLRQR